MVQIHYEGNRQKVFISFILDSMRIKYFKHKKLHNFKESNENEIDNHFKTFHADLNVKSYKVFSKMI